MSELVFKVYDQINHPAEFKRINVGKEVLFEGKTKNAELCKKSSHIIDIKFDSSKDYYDVSGVLTVNPEDVDISLLLSELEIYDSSFAINYEWREVATKGYIQNLAHPESHKCENCGEEHEYDIKNVYVGDYGGLYIDCKSCEYMIDVDMDKSQVKQIL